MVAAVPAALFGSAVCQSAAEGTVLRLLPSSLPHGLVTVRLCRSGKDVEGSWSASSQHCQQRTQLQHPHGMPSFARPTQQAAMLYLTVAAPLFEPPPSHSPPAGCYSLRRRQ